MERTCSCIGSTSLMCGGHSNVSTSDLYAAVSTSGVGRAGSDVDPLAAAVSSCAACVGGSECSLHDAASIALALTSTHLRQPAATYAAVRATDCSSASVGAVASASVAVNGADLHLHWQYVAHVRRALERVDVEFA